MLRTRRQSISPFGTPHQSTRTQDGKLAVAVLQGIHRLIERNQLRPVVKQIQLLLPLQQLREAHAYQADQEPSIIELLEQFINRRNQAVVAGGSWDTDLTGMGVKIRVTHLHRNTGRTLPQFAQIVAQLFG